MPIFLNWRNTQDGSADRFAAALFSYLSPRWYPINIIKSEIYSIFEMYGSALSFLQEELDQTHNDLAIDTVRVTSTGNQNTSKLYDNFGKQFGIAKQFNQYYDIFSTASVLSSYRQELRIMSQAFLSGGSALGVHKVGYAFTGAAPLVNEPLKADYRWRLTNKTGSVLQAGEDYIISDVMLYPFGSYLPAPPDTFGSGSPFAISYSKLGTNTKLRSKQAAYTGLEMTFFTASESTGSVSLLNTLISAVNRVVKAEQYARIKLSDKFAYYRPQTSTASVQITDVLALSDTGYLFNNAPISATGSLFTCPVLQMPSYYQNYDWFLDWMVVQANDAYAKLEVRSYNNSIIPMSIYYKEYSTEPVPLFDNPSLNSMGLHWLFNSTGSVIYDISGNLFSLQQTYYDNPPLYILSRNEKRLALVTGTGSTAYATNISSPVLQFASGFYSKMWVSGIDSSAIGTAHLLRIQELSNAGLGYNFGINIDDQTMFIDINNGVTNTATASISDLFLETPARPHYFGYTYYSGMAYFYLDGYMRASQSIGAVLPVIVGSSSLSINMYGPGIGMDELVWSEGFLTAMQAENDFITTKPRLSRLGIPSGSVDEFYQTRLTFFASGTHEIEFHQFSLKGTDRKYYIGKDIMDVDPYVVPIFLRH